PPRSAGGAVVVAWCGMRGIVTLAAALALPADFPGRDLIVFAAFCVVLGTLLLQGLTLRPLLAYLAPPRDESVEEEAALARAETARAALDALGAADQASEAGHLLTREYMARLHACVRSSEEDPTGVAALRRRALAAERLRLVALRREGQIGDDAFHRVEEELDWAEADVDERVR
ncbi:MAG: cation:proton antiporter, partial [Acetobacteraceae bacterium]|nr:cation:proton antiporter [Acetobacteraceae bacterium]